ncbi:hypothetical protein NADE_003989 [Nannochloris sp. 'desiccata']|nr:hypothetical protein NADE_003989 [Chlorella desiccata (nom. nud.)]
MPAPEPPDSFLSDEPRTLSSQLTSNPIVLGLDLAFTDQALEKEFIESHNRSQVFYDACYRLLACCSATNTILALSDRSGLLQQT